jgi:hypothetical protein
MKTILLTSHIIDIQRNDCLCFLGIEHLVTISVCIQFNQHIEMIFIGNIDSGRKINLIRSME